MTKRLEDNKFAFVLISLISISIAMFGLVANSLFTRYGGYAMGTASSTILFAVLCLVYSQVSKEVRTRTRDMFFMSLFVVFIYSIICLLVDISQINVATWAGLEPMGIAVLVFVGFFWAIAIWEVVRLVLDIFSIRIKGYEELLEGKNPFKNLKKKEEIAVNEEIEIEPVNKEEPATAPAPKATASKKKLEK